MLNAQHLRAMLYWLLGPAGMFISAIIISDWPCSLILIVASLLLMPAAGNSLEKAFTIPVPVRQ